MILVVVIHMNEEFGLGDFTTEEPPHEERSRARGACLVVDKIAGVVLSSAGAVVLGIANLPVGVT
jgi:hypothetical protein